MEFSLQSPGGGGKSHDEPILIIDELIVDETEWFLAIKLYLYMLENFFNVKKNIDALILPQIPI